MKKLLEGSLTTKEFREAVYNKKGEFNRKYKWDTNISMEEINGAEGGQDVSKLSLDLIMVNFLKFQSFFLYCSQCLNVLVISTVLN